MSDRSQFEDRTSNSRDFAGHRHSLLLHTPSSAGGSAAAYPASPAPHSAPLEAGSADTIAGLIHDTRNMVMALDLYCDLLEEPGVLAPHFGHYARELRLVSGASRRLMEGLDRLSVPGRPLLESAPGIQEISALNLLNFPDTLKQQELSGSFSTARMRSKMGTGAEMGPASEAGSTGTGLAGTSPAGTGPAGSGNVGRWPAEAGAGSMPSDSLLSMRDRMPVPTEPGTKLDGASAEFARAAMRSTESGTVSSEIMESGRSAPWPERRTRSRKPQDLFVDRRIEDLAAELHANHKLLSALAGPRVTVGLSISGGHSPIMMAPEDLTRVLVNLLRNAVEAMRGRGALQISLEEGPQFLALSFADNGPGIPRNVLDKVFSPGYSSHSATHREEGLIAHPAARSEVEGEMTQKAGDPSIAATNPPSIANMESDLSSSATSNAWPIQHRGLGLSIVRAIVTAAGGSVWASNRACNSGPSLSRAVEMQEQAASGKTRAAPPVPSAHEASSCGAIIHIEFPSSGSCSSS